MGENKTSYQGTSTVIPACFWLTGKRSSVPQRRGSVGTRVVGGCVIMIIYSKRLFGGSRLAVSIPNFLDLCQFAYFFRGWYAASAQLLSVAAAFSRNLAAAVMLGWFSIACRPIVPFIGICRSTIPNGRSGASGIQTLGGVRRFARELRPG